MGDLAPLRDQIARYRPGSRVSMTTSGGRLIDPAGPRCYGPAHRSLSGLAAVRITAVLALALGLAGCGLLTPRGEQVPLITVETQACCYLMYSVVDVVADPTFGTAIKGSGAPLRWPTGYTAWRAGTEVEIRDPAGRVVLTTGGRYWTSPTEYMPEWVVGMVRPCPDCELGGGPL